MPGRVWAAVGTALLSIVLVAGCGGGQAAAPPAPPDQVVRESYGKLVAAGTARLGTEAATQIGAQRVTVPGSGEIDFPRQGYAFTLTVPGLGPIQAVGLGNVSYLQSQQITSRIPGGRPWLLIDPARLRSAGPAGQELAETTDNPFGQLAVVQGAGPDTRVVGPDTVDNEPVTHYASTLDFARARQGADPSTANALDQYARKIGGPSVPADIWTDGQGRLRKLVLNVPAGSGRPAASVATLTFSSLGAPVTTVVAPPPGQVTDVAALLQAAGR